MAICCAFTILLTSFSSIYAYFVNEDLTYSLGVAFCTYYAVNFAFWLSKAIFVYNFLPAQNFRKKYGEWAIVTGCTDGIGRAYALELANKYKMKIILLSRTQSKLEELQKEIPTETKILAVDFSSTDNQIYEQIKNLISGLDIGVLINNVGAGYNHSDYFTQIETSDIDRLISINCFPQVKMSHLVIPGMNERKRGLIVSLSSFSGLYPMPLLALYSCCKEFKVWEDFWDNFQGCQKPGNGRVTSPKPCLLPVTSLNPCEENPNTSLFKPFNPILSPLNWPKLENPLY